MKISNNFIKYFTLYIFTIIFLRLWEVITCVFKNGNTPDIWIHEGYGLFIDMLLVSIFFNFCFIINKIIKFDDMTVKSKLLLILLVTYSILHLCILGYFNYQQTLLDIFIFQYPISEIKYTIATTDGGYSIALFSFGLLLLTIIGVNRILKYIVFWNAYKVLVKFILLISIPLFIFLNYDNEFNNFIKNKSYYFYSKSLSYFFKIGVENQPYNETDAISFQKIFDLHHYISKEYPTLHTFDAEDGLSVHLNGISKTPNIVILIMEGLGDDYLHNYRGVNLMPFLTDLRQKSLYWSHCFTMGERSFAAVPSITGGLPYGQKGFSFLKKLPNHHTLVSLLESNGFSTNFFGGQGSWFHNKDFFFKHNNADLIFDNENFNSKYSKIIVKDFFWGFNDKDLFNQFLEKTDSLPNTRRLDICFSGSMHSPFEISTPKIYNDKLNDLTKLCSKEDKSFFQKNSLYFKTILFTNDALKDFFEKYKKKPNYENTIFFITGDHPMSEIPIKNNLKKYHVPMIVFTPKLKKPLVYDQRVCHLDLFETIIPFLAHNNVIHKPLLSASIGNNLFNGKEKNRAFAFMNDNREIIDYLHGDKYINGSELYTVDNDLNIKKCKEKKTQKELKEELKSFKKTNDYICLEDKIIPDSICYDMLGYKKTNIKNQKIRSGNFNSEYHDLIETPLVNNKEKIIEVTMNTNYIPNDECLFVCEIFDTDDKLLFWNGDKIKNNTGFSHFHVKIPVSNSNKALKMKTLYWNLKKQPIEFKNFSLILYEKK